MTMPDYPSEIVLPCSYFLVTGSLYDLLVLLHHERPYITFDHHTLTPGSCRYPLFHLGADEQLVPVAQFVLRVAGDHRTHMRLESAPGYETLQPGFAELMLYFRGWLERDQEAINKFAGVSPNRQFPDDPQKALQLISRLMASAETDVIPPMPHPDIHGWSATFDWDERYGRLAGITSDKELAKRLNLSHDHVRRKRMKYGKPRRSYNHD